MSPTLGISHKDEIESTLDGGQRFKEFLLNTPLYYEIEMTGTDSDLNVLFRCNYNSYQFDCYCTVCRKESTFKRKGAVTFNFKDFKGQQSPPLNSAWRTAIVFTCQRYTSHEYVFFVNYSDKKLSKIGQSPSMEDIAASDIQRFRPVLSKEYFAELHRAGGLASHGIGIGAFVYLRRIFEKLIHDHRNQFETVNGPIENFDMLRMDQKIEALKSVLPATVVSYKQAYGSKGLHELDEATCKKHFPVVRAAIIAILEQDLHDKAKADAEKKLKEEMARIAGEINS